ncbi:MULTISPECIES: acyltransferase [Aeromicrobium]|uniref:acyltransferase n=1 Tax=Aeromicrobium TaxID=2040 RepID=UPI00210D3B95|nr:acyltransferase [Aeromicrobium sp. 636]
MRIRHHAHPRRWGRLLRRVRVLIRGLLRGHPSVVLQSGVHLTGPGDYALAARSVVREDARVWVGPGARLELGPEAKIGIRNVINVETSLTIGAGTELSWDVQILDTDFHDITDGEHRTLTRTLPVTIGEHVMIGARAMILKGVTIGDGAIIGAGSVVVHDVEPGTIVAGNPARSVGRTTGWS